MQFTPHVIYADQNSPVEICGRDRAIARAKEEAFDSESDVIKVWDVDTGEIIELDGAQIRAEAQEQREHERLERVA